MSGTTMVVWIVAMGIFGGVLSEYLKGKRKSESSTLNNESEKRIADLEERVKVLEKIATDKTSRLADEIDRL